MGTWGCGRPQGEVTIRHGPEGVSPLAGDVHVGMADRNGQLEVDVIQARGLIPKMGSKCIPATYVKVYLLENGVCLAKKKTKVVKKTCDPSYQQPLLFEESPQGKVLQVGRVTFPCPRWL
nr:regulating synaptic membrane exocytosis protein 3-like [Zonotrichia albicollis]